MPYSICVKNLKKSYGEVLAVNGISFSVKKGSFFAFLGENGAGKSTTINIIATLLKKTSGEVIIEGNRVDMNDGAIRRDIGVVFQNNMLDAFMTVRENLMSRGSMYGLGKQEVETRVKALAKTIGLDEFLDRRYGKLSGGQRRRADIARALINKPKVLILDEPTTGLDPKTRKAVWKMIKRLNKQEELTVFLTTHYMEEAAAADYIVIIDAGKIKAEGTPENLRQQYSMDKLVMVSKQQANILEHLAQSGKKYRVNKKTITVPLEHSKEAINILSPIINQIEDFEVIRGNMDDVFINVIAEKA